MKNIDEIKAEVFRRSKEKIKKRKKMRNVVITLCVCVMTISVIFAYQFNLFDVNKSGSDGNFMSEENYGVEFSSLKIEGNNKVRTEKDGSNIEKIYNILASSKEIDDSISDQEAVPPKTQGTTKYENYSYFIGDSTHICNSETEYILTFKSKKGEDKVYILKGNVLTDKSSKQEVKLTNAELIELQKLLNLQIILEEK